MDKQIAASFGTVLRRERKQAGISQEELATAAGLHRTYVSLIERGHRTASIEVVRRLADALGKSMADLISKTERDYGAQAPRRG